MAHRHRRAEADGAGFHGLLDQLLHRADLVGSGATVVASIWGRRPEDYAEAAELLADFLTEEARLAPGPLEVASFNDDVEVLAQQMKAVELRLARLEQQVS